jgi:IMP dehydrogenase
VKDGSAHVVSTEIGSGSRSVQVAINDEQQRTKMLEGLSYDDVLLVPQCGVLEKRENADLSSEVAVNIPVTIPIISAPMPSVTEGEMAKAMVTLGGQAVIHRFQDIEKRLDQYFGAYTSPEIASPFIAIGLKDNMDDIERMVSDEVFTFCLDVAHGHHEQVIQYVKDLKERFELTLIVGNVATASGALALATAGADAIKVGIGPGAACRTREVTGFGVPQLTAILNVKEQLDSWGIDVPIIADGGIKNSGDIVKALAAGASAVMLGSLLAGADEAPKPGEYYGNASTRLNGHRAPEGVEGSVPLSGPVENIIKELTWGIRSGISYAGATNIRELQAMAEFIRVAPGVSQESSVRV